MTSRISSRTVVRRVDRYPNAAVLASIDLTTKCAGVAGIQQPEWAKEQDEKDGETNAFHVCCDEITASWVFHWHGQSPIEDENDP